MSRVLISGFYGFGNAGDEAVLAAMVQLFRERRPGVELAVLSADPSATQQLHGVDAVPRMVPGPIAAAIRACDLFVSGGGSLLQDATSVRSPLYYLALVHLAARARKPVALFCQGIGPLRRPVLRRLTRAVLNRAALITVRDEESARELRRLGVGREVLHYRDTERAEEDGEDRPGAFLSPPLRDLRTSVGNGTRRPPPPILVAADPVFALQPAPEFDAARWLPERPAGGWLGVSVRPWPGVEAMIPRLAEALRGIAARTGLTPLLLPLQWDADHPVCARVRERVPGAAILLRPGLAPREWLALVGRLEALVAMRLHALIFAAVENIPPVGISYDPKVDALLEQLGERPAATVADLNPEALVASVCMSLADAAAAERRRSAAAHQAVAARTAADLTLSLLGGQG